MGNKPALPDPVPQEREGLGLGGTRLVYAVHQTLPSLVAVGLAWETSGSHACTDKLTPIASESSICSQLCTKLIFRLIFDEKSFPQDSQSKVELVG